MVFVRAPVIPVTLVTLNRNVQTPRLEVPPTGVEAAGMVAPPSDTLVLPAVALTVPPVQVVEALGGFAICSPAGRLSVTAALVNAMNWALLMVTVRVEVCPWKIDVGLKLLEMGASAWALSVAVKALVFVIPRLLVMAPAGTLLVKEAALDAVTKTVTWQLPLAGMVPPASDTLDAPGTAVTVPPQLVVGLGVAASLTPAGKLSVKAVPGTLIVLPLLSVIVSLETPATGIVLGANALLAEIALRVLTCKVALAAWGLVCPSAVVKALAGMVLTELPELVETTSTVNWQLPSTAPARAGIVPPAREAAVLPAIAPTLPPQVLVTLGLGATVMPAGKLSVMDAAVSGLLLLL